MVPPVGVIELCTWSDIICSFCNAGRLLICTEYAKSSVMRRSRTAGDALQQAVRAMATTQISGLRNHQHPLHRTHHEARLTLGQAGALHELDRQYSLRQPCGLTAKRNGRASSSSPPTLSRTCADFLTRLFGSENCFRPLTMNLQFSTASLLWVPCIDASPKVATRTSRNLPCWTGTCNLLCGNQIKRSRIC